MRIAENTAKNTAFLVRIGGYYLCDKYGLNLRNAVLSRSPSVSY